MSAKKKTTDFDVVIAGGGPSGCTMAALLGQSGIKVACIDRDDPTKSLSPAFDGRTTAISFGSRCVLEGAGVWQGLEGHGCAIKDIKITDNGSPVLLEFLADEVQADAFGWVFENRVLRANLYKTLQSLKTVSHIAPAGIVDYTVDDDGVDVVLSDGRTLRTKLVIGADGRNSFTREWMGIGTRGWSYRQRAIVCVVGHENPHDNIATEDFRSDGPFAILPMLNDEKGGHRSALVWTEHALEKSSALHWDDAVFMAAIAERIPAMYGQIISVAPRFSYPLGLSHAHSYIGPRMALIADAAHGIHPIAGQGLNIGLRDVAALAELLTGAQDCGNADILRAYERARRFDNMTMAAATDGLNKLFSNNITPLRILRKAGLQMVAHMPPAKKFFMRHAMGSGGLLPSLVRGGKPDT